MAAFQAEVRNHIMLSNSLLREVVEAEFGVFLHMLRMSLRMRSTIT
jgi:hypothetical protein